MPDVIVVELTQCVTFFCDARVNGIGSSEDV